MNRINPKINLWLGDLTREILCNQSLSIEIFNNVYEETIIHGKTAGNTRKHKQFVVCKYGQNYETRGVLQSKTWELPYSYKRIYLTLKLGYSQYTPHIKSPMGDCHLRLEIVDDEIHLILYY